MKSLYLIKPIKIQCAETTDKQISGIHTWLEINTPYIDVVDIKEHEITFHYNGKKWIYWADMSMFLKRFKSQDEVRDEKIKIIIE